jgi:hypothetical protein
LKEPLIKGGYILQPRKITDSEIFKKPPLYLKVWIYLLTRAQHSSYKELNRGQLYTSIPEIQEACSHYIGCRKEKPTKDQIFNILEWMRGENSTVTKATSKATSKATMITTMKATHGILVTIDNYSVYQDSKNYESNDESNNESNDEGVSISNNINKNDNKNDKYIDHFDSFWMAYPKKVGKDAAQKSFYKLKVDKELIQSILSAIEVQKKSNQWKDKQFIPNPTTWLNQRRWEDELECTELNEHVTMTADGTFKI